jgi:hypothetical protein
MKFTLSSESYSLYYYLLSPFLVLTFVLSLIDFDNENLPG